MKLKADKYFIVSNKRRTNPINMPPTEYLEVCSYYHFDTEKPLYENGIQLFDSNNEPYPSYFEIWEQLNSDTPKIVKWWRDLKSHGSLKLSLSQPVFPGEVLTIKLTDLNYGFNPCIQMPHLMEENCKEIKIYGIERESNFGLNIDVGSEYIGGTYYKLNSIFSEKNVNYSIIGYSVFMDLNIDPNLSKLDILSMLKSDIHFQYTGTTFNTSHPFVIHKLKNGHPLGDTLLPGNKYTAILLTCDQKGRWQLFIKEFVTKKREVKIEILEVRTEYVGDTDGVGDETIINTITLTQNLNFPLPGIGLFRGIFWNADHRSNEILTLNPNNFRVTIPFLKYNTNSKIIIYTWGEELNGTDYDGEAWSYLDELDWPPYPNTIPADNGVVSNYFNTGERETDPSSCYVVAVNKERTTSFVYHLKLRLTCRYQ